MSDIDKDIERVKELQSTIYEGGDYIYLNKNDKQAIENVLLELEKKEFEIKVKTINLALLNDNNNKLKSELETYKKIADLMASQINNYDAQLVINKFRSKEDILDWARKEVEKDVK